MSDKNTKKIDESNSNNKKTAKVILIIIAVLMIIIGSVSFGIYLYNQYGADVADRELSSVASTTQAASDNEDKAENPIDFDALKEKNDEIYAWIKVPGTKVDYPIVQSADNDEFYLKHSALDKKWLASGAIYTEGCNRTDFSDPITVIYGHNGYKETMFTTLHKFENSEFFNSHEYFYIYMPGRKLTYQIISAFKYDDRHIMNSFNFSSAEDLQGFQSTVVNPTSALKNVREQLEAPVDENSKISGLF